MKRPKITSMSKPNNSENPMIKNLNLLREIDLVNITHLNGNKVSNEALQMLSKALTLIVFNNGIVGEMCKDNVRLCNESLNTISGDVNNRIYTLLDAFLNNDSKDFVPYETLMALNASLINNWSDAKKVSLLTAGDTTIKRKAKVVKPTL